MNLNLLKIGIIITLAVLLPSFFFTIVQLNSVKDTEKEIESIYKNRLGTVIYSVNQHTEDLINGWKTLANSSLMLDNKGTIEKLNNLSDSNPAIKEIIFFDNDGKPAGIFSGNNKKPLFGNVYNSFTASYSKLLIRLQTYKRGGYQKNEPLPWPDSSSTSIVFLTEENPAKINTGVIVIDKKEFISSNIYPRMQESSRDELTMWISDTTTGTLSASTGKIENTEADFSDALWYLPGSKLFISINGTSLETLVNSRLYTNIGLLVMLNLFIIAAAAFLYYSLRRQMEITRMKADFVSNVSHELRTPLALITMFAETLEMDRVKTEEKKKEYYNIISKEAGRLSRIVNKILNFSRMEAGKQKFSFSTANLNNIIDDILYTYSYHLENKGFTVEFVKENSLPDFSADQEAIAEAVINIIDNAVKYSGDRKEIEIVTKSTAGFVVLAISDRGIGIPDKDKKKIFDKFFRASGGLIQETRGTGLGLSLVKQIVDVHNGTITVGDTPDGGTTFVIKIPVKTNTGE